MSPPPWSEGRWGLCPSRALTGLYCPLCGGLRSAYALSRLDLAQAVRDNALFVVALPVLLLVWLDWLRRDRADPQPDRGAALGRLTTRLSGRASAW